MAMPYEIYIESTRQHITSNGLAFPSFGGVQISIVEIALQTQTPEPRVARKSGFGGLNIIAVLITKSVEDLLIKEIY